MAQSFLEYMEKKRNDCLMAISGQQVGISKLIAKGADIIKIKATQDSMVSAQRKLVWVERQIAEYTAATSCAGKLNQVISSVTSIRDSYLSDIKNQKSTPAQRHYAKQVVEKLNAVLSA